MSRIVKVLPLTFLLVLQIVAGIPKLNNPCKSCDMVSVEEGSPDTANQAFRSAFPISSGDCATTELLECSDICVQNTRKLRLKWDDGSMPDSVGTYTVVRCGETEPTCDIWANPDYGFYPDSSSSLFTINLDKCEDFKNDDIPRESLGLPDEEDDKESVNCSTCSEVYLLQEDGTDIQQNSGDSVSCSSPGSKECSVGLTCSTQTLIYMTGGRILKLLSKGCLPSDITCADLKAAQQERVPESDIDFRDCDLLFTDPLSQSDEGGDNETLESDKTKDSNYTVEEEEVTDGSNNSCIIQFNLSVVLLGVLSNFLWWIC